MAIEPLEERNLLTVTMSFDPPSGVIGESGSATLIGTLDSPRANPVTVNISMNLPGTSASFYSEYLLSGNQITIPPGQLTGSVTFISYDDPIFEGDETVEFGFSSQGPSPEPIDPSTASLTLTVTDDPADPFTIDDGILTLPGTAGDDVFLFNNLGIEVIFVQVNNTYAYVNKLAISAVEFDGLGGNDTSYVLYSTDVGRGSLTLSPGSLSSTTGLNVKAETIFAYNPSNVVTIDTFQGTSGNDVFYGLQGGSIFSSGNSMIATTFQVGQVGLLVEDSAGHDISILVGAVSMTFIGEPDRFQMLQGPSTRIDVRGQNEVYAYGSQASFLGSELHGSAGNDVFYGLPGFVGLKGDTFWHQLMGNPTVRVHGEGGIDIAVMQDTAGNDSFVGGPGNVTFSGDVSFSFGNPVPRYSFEVNNFAYVFMDRLYGGNDTALITDSAGDDDLAVAGNSATFTGGGSYIRTTGFPTLTARSTTGRDIARRSAIDYALTLEGPWVEV